MLPWRFTLGQCLYRAQLKFLKIALAALKLAIAILKDLCEFSTSGDPNLGGGCGLKFDCKVTCNAGGSFFLITPLTGSEN